MYIQAILSTVQTKLRGKLKLNLNLGICGSGMLREEQQRGLRIVGLRVRGDCGLWAD